MLSETARTISRVMSNLESRAKIPRERVSKFLEKLVKIVADETFPISLLGFIVVNSYKNCICRWKAWQGQGRRTRKRQSRETFFQFTYLVERGKTLLSELANWEKAELSFSSSQNLVWSTLANRRK